MYAYRSHHAITDVESILQEPMRSQLCSTTDQQEKLKAAKKKVRTSNMFTYAPVLPAARKTPGVIHTEIPSDFGKKTF